MLGLKLNHVSKRGHSSQGISRPRRSLGIFVFKVRDNQWEKSGKAREYFIGYKLRSKKNRQKLGNIEPQEYSVLKFVKLQWCHNECHMESQITSIWTFCSGAHQRKHQSSTSLAFMREPTGDSWIPITNGQWGRKCLNLMMSSWQYIILCNFRVQCGLHWTHTE